MLRYTQHERLEWLASWTGHLSNAVKLRTVGANSFALLAVSGRMNSTLQFVTNSLT
jgi:hypothetical protein